MKNNICRSLLSLVKKLSKNIGTYIQGTVISRPGSTLPVNPMLSTYTEKYARGALA